MMRDRDETLRAISILSGKDGYIGREVTGPPLFVSSEIELRDGSLIWGKGEDPVSGEMPGHARRSKLGALDAFIRLAWPEPSAKRDGDDVLAFARKWGVLELCAHGLPYTHLYGDIPVREGLMSRWTRNSTYSKRLCFQQRDSDNEEYIESVADWRLFARRAADLLRVSSKLRSRAEIAENETVKRMA